MLAWGQLGPYLVARRVAGFQAGAGTGGRKRCPTPYRIPLPTIFVDCSNAVRCYLKLRNLLPGLVSGLTAPV